MKVLPSLDFPALHSATLFSVHTQLPSATFTFRVQSCKLHAHSLDVSSASAPSCPPLDTISALQAHTTALPAPLGVRLLAQGKERHVSGWPSQQGLQQRNLDYGARRRWREGKRNKAAITAQCMRNIVQGSRSGGAIWKLRLGAWQGLWRNFVQRRQPFINSKPPWPAKGSKLPFSQQPHWFQWDMESWYSCRPWALLELFINSNSL